jgi:hypothetical protein
MATISGPTGGLPYTQIADMTTTADTGNLSGSISGTNITPALRNSYLRISSAAAAARYGFRKTFTSIDLSDSLVIATAFAFTLGTLANLAGGGIQIAFYSASGWRLFTIGGSDTAAVSTAGNVVNYRPCLINVASSTPTSSGGTFDSTAVIAAEFFMTKTTAATVEVVFGPLLKVLPLTLTGGTSEAPGRFRNLQFGNVSGGLNLSQYNTVQADQLFSTVSLQIGGGTGIAASTYLLSVAESIATPGIFNATAPRENGYILPGDVEINIRPRNSDTMILNNFLVSSGQKAAFNIHAPISGAATVTLSAGTLFNRSSVLLRNATLTGVNIVESGLVTAIATTFDGGAIEDSDGNSILITESVLATGFAIRRSGGSAIVIDVAGDTTTNFSGFQSRVRDSTTYDILIQNSSPGTGQTYAIDLSGITAVSGSTSPTIRIYVDDDEPTNIYDITTNSTYSQGSADSAGAAINILAPTVTTVIFGFPTSANEHGVNPAPVLGIYEADGTFIAALDVTDPEYSNGSFTIEPADYGPGTILVSGSAVGWRRTGFSSIDTAAPQSVVDLGPGFEEYTDDRGNAFIGTSSATTGLTFDAANNRIELASNSGGNGGAYDFAGVAFRLSQLGASKSGMELFPTPLIRQIQFVRVAGFYDRIFTPPEFKVTANATAATYPVILDFALISLDNASPFVQGLASDAPGLTVRPNVSIAFQAPPTTVQLAGGNQVQLAPDTEANLLEQIEGFVLTEGQRIRGEVTIP